MDSTMANGMPAGLPLATLETIDIQKLRDQDPVEKQNLLKAAKEEGFFYLNLQNFVEVDKLTSILGGIYGLEHRLFELPEEEKMKYDVDTFGPMKLNGYKPVGRNVGGVDGKRDGFESWAVPKDGVMGIESTTFTKPAVIDAQLGLLQGFMRYMQDFTTTIYKALSDTLGIEGDKRLELFHQKDHLSPCILRLLKYHAQPATERGAVQTPHTDLGSLTILFTSQPGLQVLKSGTEVDAWEFVAPRPYCAIVNIGDTLSMMTGGKLQSSLHRVGPLPGLPMDTRYSFAYLQRPEEHTSLKLPGGDGSVTSGEWLRKKFGMLRKDTYSHGDQWVLTGRQNVDVIPAAV